MRAAAEYYQGTARPFRALCPERSGHMNVGYWPAPSLREAQESLVWSTVDHCIERLPGLTTVVDAGSGWGGSARLFSQRISGLRYLGVNLSGDQVEAARCANADLPGVRFQQCAIEDFVHTMDPVDCFVSIEAAFHFENKAALIHALKSKVRLLTLLEICVEVPQAVASNPLLRGALREAWSAARYLASLRSAGFHSLLIEDVSERTFPSFSEHLCGLDSAGYDESPAILRQFRSAFSAMTRLQRAGALRYLRISALA